MLYVTTTTTVETTVMNWDVALAPMTSSDVTMVTALMPHTCVMAQSNAHTITTTTEEMMSKDALVTISFAVTIRDALTIQKHATR